jgi:hypothetical protein
MWLNFARRSSATGLVALVLLALAPGVASASTVLHSLTTLSVGALKAAGHSSQGVSWGSIGSDLASGAGGGLLVLIITVALGRARDRRDAKVAAYVVRDELSAAVNTLTMGRISGAIPLPGEAAAFDTDAYRAYRLLMHRRLALDTMQIVADAYRQLAGVSVSALEELSGHSLDLMKNAANEAVGALATYCRDRSQRSAWAGPIRLQWPITHKSPALSPPEPEG